MKRNNWILSTGASVIDNRTVMFRVWAPFVSSISVEITSQSQVKLIRLEKDERGYFTGYSDGLSGGDLYFYALEGKTRYPDPASRSQPAGVHGPSQIVDPSDFTWNDGDWSGIPLPDYIIYEIHVGTFSREGTFEAVISRLDYLKGLGINAVELMPVAQFPGSRNWGYDVSYIFAPQNSYGGPNGLKSLINACHEKGLAVILDVVYNHLGPEGNYLGKFGPYFTDRYKTPWGKAVNFDGPHSDEVRQFFTDNALYWLTEYHADALRVDAIHGIYDFSARHFLRELADTVHDQSGVLGKPLYVIAESDLNDVRFIKPVDECGCGLDAQWNDDFHHSLHSLITGDNMGYYQDFGGTEHLAKALTDGFVYSGQYSRFRKRRHGSPSMEVPAHQFIVFAQNHDQIGNRISGDRLSQTQSLEKLKLAAGVVILVPQIPLIFMGEEYGEEAPFQYFTSHSDAALTEEIRRGRREQFSSLKWKGEMPDPDEEGTFLNSRIDIQKHLVGSHRTLFDFYRRLIDLRKHIPAFKNLLKENMEVEELGGRVLLVRRWFEGEYVFSIYNFGEKHGEKMVKVRDGLWEEILDSSSREWGGERDRLPQSAECPGGEIRVSLRPYSFAVYRIRDGLHPAQWGDISG